MRGTSPWKGIRWINGLHYFSFTICVQIHLFDSQSTYLGIEVITSSSAFVSEYAKPDLLPETFRDSISLKIRHRYTLKGTMPICIIISLLSLAVTSVHPWFTDNYCTYHTLRLKLTDCEQSLDNVGGEFPWCTGGCCIIIFWCMWYCFKMKSKACRAPKSHNHPENCKKTTTVRILIFVFHWEKISLKSCAWKCH